MWIRLAAPAIVLALASPVWATETEMKKKEDPKAEQKEGVPQQKKQDPAKDSEQQQAKKKNCPVDIMSFNTLEDMYGFVGPVDPLALQQKQQAEQVKPQTAAGTTATQGVEWRTVEESKKTDDDAKKKDE